MNKFLLTAVLGALLVVQTGFAAEQSTSSMEIPKSEVRSALANINKGNFEVGGSVTGVKDTNGGDPSVGMDPFFRYFVLNSFSLGVVTNLQFAEDYRYLGFGPSAALYFAQAGKAVFFIGEDFLITNIKQTYRYYGSGYESASYESNHWVGVSATRLGMNYFIVPEVAVGPSLNYTFYMGDGRSNNNGILSLKGQFSLYF